jgi:hypothetical protein
MRFAPSRSWSSRAAFATLLTRAQLDSYRLDRIPLVTGRESTTTRASR